jgi:copper resistance protein B
MNGARIALIGSVLTVAMQIPYSAAEPSLAQANSVPAAPMTGMAMDDSVAVGKVMLDQLEQEAGSGNAILAWDGQAWYGADYNKLWLKSEGSPNPDDKTDARSELLWDHVIARWWSVQTGVRYDLVQGPARGWVAAGIQGLAPYWFDVEATLYLGDGGRTAARFRAEHDVLLTQRLIVQPEFEADLYGKTDAARQIGSGLSDFQLGLRARYEIRREIAPYIGLAWRRDVGGTAQFARTNGLAPNALLFVAGFHVWF